MGDLPTHLASEPCVTIHMARTKEGKREVEAPTATAPHPCCYREAGHLLCQTHPLNNRHHPSPGCQAGPGERRYPVSHSIQDSTAAAVPHVYF